MKYRNVNYWDKQTHKTVKLFWNEIETKDKIAITTIIR